TRAHSVYRAQGGSHLCSSCASGGKPPGYPEIRFNDGTQAWTLDGRRRHRNHRRLAPAATVRLQGRAGLSAREADACGGPLAVDQAASRAYSVAARAACECEAHKAGNEGEVGVMGTIKVLVVDDSAVVRQVVGGLLQAHPDIEVIGACSDPLLAQE